jgi:hypothetical protein
MGDPTGRVTGFTSREGAQDSFARGVVYPPYMTVS